MSGYGSPSGRSRETVQHFGKFRTASAPRLSRPEEATLLVERFRPMDPLSITGTVAGLISLAQSLIPLLFRYVDYVSAYPKEFTELREEIDSFRDVLCVFQPTVQKIESGSSMAQGIAPQYCLPPGSVDSVLSELQKCRALLNEFVDILERYDPHNMKQGAKGLKALVFVLKKGSRDSMISRLERHKQVLILALMGLFVYVPCQRQSNYLTRQFGVQEADAALEERQAARQERIEANSEREETRKRREDERLQQASIPNFFSLANVNQSSNGTISWSGYRRVLFREHTSPSKLNGL